MSNYSNIGFLVDSIKDLQQLADKVSTIGSHVPGKKGSFITYSDTSGAELWLQLNKKNQPVGLAPHFRGISEMKVCLTSEIKIPNDGLDTTMQAWADPAELNNPKSGEFPFAFEVPDGAKYGALQFPQDLTIQLAAFAHEISYYDDQELYYAAQGEELVWAVPSFCPAGLFEEHTNHSPAYAHFTGTIKAFKKLKNELTQREFYWLLAKTIGGEIDIVVDINLVEKEPIIDGVVQGVFWMSGQLKNEPILSNLRKKLQKAVNPLAIWQYIINATTKPK